MANLTLETAMKITQYYLSRNATAKRSHEKRWRAQHKNVKFKVLL
jgi:hypothetical protein